MLTTPSSQGSSYLPLL